MAVLLVVLYHVGLVPGGFVGVDVFFVISGFVITAMAMRRLDHRQGIRLWSFFGRRVMRLMPALAFMSAGTLLISCVLLNPVDSQQVAASTAFAGSLVAANVYLFSESGGYFDPGSDLNPFLHLWSLAVEEQFYLFFPVAAALVWRAALVPLGARRAGHAVVAVLGVAAAMSFAASVALTRTDSVLGVERIDSFAFYASPIRAWEFLAGAFLAFGASRIRRLPIAMFRVFTWAGAGAVLLSASVFDAATAFPGSAALLPVGGTAAMIAGGMRRRTRLRALEHPAVVWLGDRSYGWYLWHWPLIVFARVAVGDDTVVLVAAAVIALLPAMFSFTHFEYGLQRPGPLRVRRTATVAGLCVAVPLVLSTIILVATDRSWGSRVVADAVAQQQLHADTTQGCDHVPDALVLDQCWWPAESADATGTAAGTVVRTGSFVRPTVALLGDSNAGHFTEAVASAATSNGFDFRVATVHGCPFIDARVSSSTDDGRGCEAEVAHLIAETVRLRPDVVVLASATDRYLAEDIDVSVDPSLRSTEQPTAAEAWAVGLRSVLTTFERAGIGVLVVHPVPRFDDWSFGLCPNITILDDVERCGTERSRADVAAAHQSAFEVEQEALAGLSSVRTLDVGTALCPTEICSTNEGNTWTYRDSSHITVFASLSLAGEFSQAIEWFQDPGTG